MFVLPVFIPFHKFSHFCPHDPLPSLSGREVSEWLDGVGYLSSPCFLVLEMGCFFTKVPLHSPFLLPLTSLPESHHCTFSLGHKVTSVLKQKEFKLTKFMANFDLLRFTLSWPRLHTHVIMGKGGASTISIIHVFNCVGYILSWFFKILLILLISLCTIWAGKIINHIFLCLVLCGIQWKNISLW